MREQRKMIVIKYARMILENYFFDYLRCMITF